MIKDFIALDTETTGLSHKKERIIEIGAVRVRDGEICETYSRLIACPRPLEQRIIELTGITDEMLAGAPAIDRVMEEFIHFCGDDVIAGHMLMFDYRFLKTAATALHLPFEKMGLDTLEIARALHPDLPSKRLGDMCAYYGIEGLQFHRAADDALACAGLLLAMGERFGESHEALFKPKQLQFKVKRSKPASRKQKAYLKSLIKYHKIDNDIDVEALSMSEISRMVDQVILKHGKMMT